MKFNLDDIFDKPSFYFAAHQGLVFAVMVAAAVISVVIGCFFIDIYTSIFSSIFCSLLFLPYVILYTFLTFMIALYIGVKTWLYKKGFVLFNFAVLFILYRLFAFDESAMTFGGGAVVIMGVFSIILLFWGFILLNLVPYIVLRYREKKYNISTTVEPFVNNGFYLKTILYSLVIYLLICILICVLAASFMVRF